MTKTPKIFWLEEDYDANVQGYITHSGYTENDGLVRFRVSMLTNRKFWIAQAASLVVGENGLTTIGWNTVGQFVNVQLAKEFLEAWYSTPPEGLRVSK